jgi:hypothetical protein
MVSLVTSWLSITLAGLLTEAMFGSGLSINAAFAFGLNLGVTNDRMNTNVETQSPANSAGVQNVMKPRSLCLGALAGVVLLLAGCLPTSVFPPFTEKDLVAQPLLAGTWNPNEADGPNTNEFWTFRTTGEAKVYDLTIKDSDGEGQFKAYCFRLKDATLLDIVPEGEPPKGTAGIHRFLYQPLHTWFRIEKINESRFEFLPMSLEWLGEYLEKNPAALAHCVTGEKDKRLTITASTADLQKFLREHMDENKVWGEPSRLIRQAAAPAAPEKK